MSFSTSSPTTWMHSTATSTARRPWSAESGCKDGSTSRRPSTCGWSGRHGATKSACWTTMGPPIDPSSSPWPRSVSSSGRGPCANIGTSIGCSAISIGSIRPAGCPTPRSPNGSPLRHRPPSSEGSQKQRQERLAVLRSADAEALFTLAVAYYNERRRFALAAATATRVIAGSQGLRGLSAPGHGAAQVCRYAAALTDADNALQIDPDNDDAYVATAAARVELGQYDRAKADLDRAVRIGGDDAQARYYRGRAWMGSGNPRQALLRVVSGLPYCWRRRYIIIAAWRTGRWETCPRPRPNWPRRLNSIRNSQMLPAPSARRAGGEGVRRVG